MLTAFRWKRMVEPFAGNGIIMLEGDEHRAHRKMLNAAFTPANLRRLGTVFREKRWVINLMM